MKTILITGGAGFIGSNFIHYINRVYPEYKIINLDKLTYAGNLENLKEIEAEPNYRFVKGDICDRELVCKIFSEYDIDTVVNFAAESHVDRSILGPEEFIRTNIYGTFTLLEAAKGEWLDQHVDNKGRDCLFLHVSTDEVYGSLSEEGYFTEDTPYAPNSPYSASKAASDHLVRAYNRTYGLPVITTNASNNYGPYQFPEKLIPLMIINAIEDRPLPIYGDGNNIRDWIYVEDHCRALDLIIHRGRVGETYNISGGNEYRNIALVMLICDLLETRLKLSKGTKRNLITFVKDRPGHDRRYATDSSKLKNQLCWSPLYRLEEGLEKTIDWYLNHRDWWERIMTGNYMDYYKLQYGER